MTRKPTQAQKERVYAWSGELGVTYISKNGVERQALQLLLFPASRKFRARCGRLLVEALNKAKAK
jgi:hypothetical protein